MDSTDGPPPLEDMTELLQQVTALREVKNTKSGGASREIKQKSNGHAFINGKEQKELSKPTTAENNPKTNSNNEKTVQSAKAAEKVPVKEQSRTQIKSKEGFAGMKKGFLFGGASKSQSQNSNSTKHNEQKSNVEKVNRTLEDIPFITKKDETKTLQFSEVQEAMAKTNEKLMENKDWVTDDLLEQLEKNDKLSKRLQNPMFVQAIGEFQKNPEEAMKKYGSNKEIQEFFTEFCGLMGKHFNKLGDQEGPASQTGSQASPVITTASSGRGADMSVRSSTNPNQPTAADEKKMQDILSDPDIRVILMDPKVQELFEVLRKDPIQGQRMMQSAPSDFKQKIQKLVSVGLLQFQ